MIHEDYISKDTQFIVFHLCNCPETKEAPPNVERSLTNLLLASFAFEIVVWPFGPIKAILAPEMDSDNPME